MKQLIEFIAKKLVDHPEDVQVTVIENEDGQCYELRLSLIHISEPTRPY